MKQPKGIVKFHRIIFILAILSILSIIFIILAFSKYTFHSDCAMFLFLAKEQVKQLKLFPDRFHYTTELASFSPSLFMIPFVKLLENNYLIHEMGSILALVFVAGSILILFQDKKVCAALTFILFFLPLGYTYMDMLFYQSAYISSILFSVLELLCVKYLFILDEVQNTKKKIFIWTAYAVCMVIMNYSSIREIAIIVIPALCAWAAMIFLREGGRVKDWARQKRLLGYIAVTLVLLALCILHYILLCRRLEFDSPTSMGGLVSLEQMMQNWSYTVISLLDLYGINSTKSLFHISTIKQCIMILYLVLSVFIIPIFLLLNVRKIKEPFYQFLVLYTQFVRFINMILMFFCGYREGRYYIPLAFNNVLLFALVIYWLYESRRERFSIWPVVLVLCGSVIVHANYYISIEEDGWYDNFSIQSLVNPSVHSGNVEILRQKGLTYGYASFWNAYSTMIASNCEIEIAAYDQGNPLLPYYFDHNDPQAPYYYGVSEDLYQKELHQGPCFILVQYNEVIPDKYYETADEILHSDGFTILLYHQNIQLYPELTENDGRFISIESPYKFDWGIQEYGEASFYQNGICCLLPGGQMELNYVDVKKGTYYITIEGEMGIQNTDVRADILHGKIHMKCLSSSETEKKYMFEADDDLAGVQITLENTGDKLLKITSAVVSR